MKKILSQIISLTLLFSAAIGVNAHASEVDKNSNGSDIENVQFIEITRDEYLQTLADKEGISLEEADILDKAQTEESIANERKTALMNKQVMPLSAEVVYSQVIKRFNTGTYGAFSSSVIATLNTKLMRYNVSGYGEYQKFTNVLDKKIQAYGSGIATYASGTISAPIDYDTGYGNSIVLMFSGNVEHEIGISLTGNAKNAGFSVTTSGKYIARKLISEQYTFSSNYKYE